MGLTSHRYEIGCSYCGVVSYERNFNDALAKAKHEATRHNGANETIRIGNLLARHGAPELWDINGNVLKYRS